MLAAQNTVLTGATPLCSGPLYILHTVKWGGAVPTLFERPVAPVPESLLSEAVPSSLSRKRASSSSSLADAGSLKKKRAAYGK